MFNKSFCVAGALNALAMSINTALGVYVTDEDLAYLFSKRDGIMEKMEKLNPGAIGAIRTIVQQIYPRLGNLAKDDIKAIWFELCLGINPKFLEKCPSEYRISLSEELKDDELFCAFIHESPDEMWRSPDETYQLGSTDGSVIPVLEVLLKHTDLVSQLDLYASFIGDSGASNLAEALEVNSSLTTLDLGDNEIGDSGALSLSEALKVNSSLTQLSLCNNLIYSSGASSLAEALKVNSSLTQLGLRDNNIGASGASSIAEALKVNSSLTTLGLPWNGIGDSGANSLSEALEVNSSLTQLGLFHNDIGDSGASSIAEALKVNSSLTQLDLRDNNIGDSGKEALADALKSNVKIDLPF